MPQRTLLRDQISEAWCRTIKARYQEQLINSERGLQVYFCAALLEIFREARLRRRIFIEPAISATSSPDLRYPDIVICNTKRVIGVIELKYQPRGRPSYTKDIKTLEFVATHSNGLVISNDRFLGIAVDGHAYPLAKDAVLCWGGVYTGAALDLSSKVSTNLGAVFMQLHAVTAPNQNPIVSTTGAKRR